MAELTSLIKAITDGSVRGVRKWLCDNKEVNVNDPLPTGETAFFLACARGQFKIANILYKKGAFLDVRINGETPFSIATKNGHRKLAVNIAHKFSHRFGMCVASTYGHHNLVKQYCAKGVDVSTPLDNGRTALYMACRGPYDYYHFVSTEKVLRFLIKNGADVNAKIPSGDTPLMAAVLQNHYSIVKLLVENGADINIRNPCGATALHLACDHEYTEIASFLSKKEQEQFLSKSACGTI